MKLKFILSTLIFTLIAVGAFSQVVSPASATSAPLTSPISSALKQVSGTVYYLSLSVYRFVPAAGAAVSAKNSQTGEMFSATVDAKGHYNLSIPVGKYSLWAEGAGFTAYKFVPTFNNLPIIFDLPHLDFFGLPKH